MFAIVIDGIAPGRAAANVVFGAARVRGHIAGAARDRAAVLAALAHGPAVLAHCLPGRVRGSRRPAA